MHFVDTVEGHAGPPQIVILDDQNQCLDIAVQRQGNGSTMEPLRRKMQRIPLGVQGLAVVAQVAPESPRVS